LGQAGKGRTRKNKTVEFMEERGYRLLYPYEVAPDTLDMFFVLKEMKDPSVFSRPRVDVAKFFEARARCQEHSGLFLSQSKMCL